MTGRGKAERGTGTGPGEDTPAGAPGAGDPSAPGPAASVPSPAEQTRLGAPHPTALVPALPVAPATLPGAAHSSGLAGIPGVRRLPVLPLRGLAVFPGARVPLQIGRPGSLRAVTAAVAEDHRLLFCAQRDPRCDDPGPDDLHAVGSIAILRDVRTEDGAVVRIVAEGLGRVRLRDLAFGASGGEATAPAPESDAGAVRGQGRRSAASPSPDADGGPPGGGPADRCLYATAEVLVDDEAESNLEPEISARAAAVLRRFERLRAAGGKDRVGGDAPLPGVDEPGRLCDAIAARALQRPEDRQAILEAVSVRERLARLHRLLLREVEESEVERDVATRARRQMERAQREYYLREQLKAIQKELGEASVPEAGHGEAADLRSRIAAAGLPAPVGERAERELQRLEKMPPMAAEAVVARTYLEWLAALPWAARAEERLDLDEAERVLDEDHHGLVQVKERILEYLALRLLQTRREAGGPARGPILCLVGPPGCGKTSLARSVARALGRPFARISLGGVRDEAEVRGHRRTYVGALPGRIIAAMRQAGVRNPVVLLDEIDKMSADYRGDPAAALLEVLDTEQNAAFTDHYLEVPFDLSEVLFICTANHLGPLPRPLHDRLEVLHLQGYGEAEKLAIARRYLLPRQVREAALPEGALRVTDGAIRVLIDRYTREAGVRSLERALGAICRKVARRVVAGGAAGDTGGMPARAVTLARDGNVVAGASGSARAPAQARTGRKRSGAEPAETGASRRGARPGPGGPSVETGPTTAPGAAAPVSRSVRVTVTARNVSSLLGQPKVYRQGALARDAVGVAMGLAWTETGGDVLPVEVSVLPGRGSLQLTGQLGDVMRESAQAALTFVRANAHAFGLPPDFYGRCELHVHVPEGAVPKDGPSAGITLAAALLSAVSGARVRADVALTGEITLRGRLLPVGGIKEKVLAARRAGLRRVILPEENRADWEEVRHAAGGMAATFADTAEEALAAAFVGGLPSSGAGGERQVPAALLAPPPAPPPATVTDAAV